MTDPSGVANHRTQGGHAHSTEWWDENDQDDDEKGEDNLLLSVTRTPGKVLFIKLTQPERQQDHGGSEGSTLHDLVLATANRWTRSRNLTPAQCEQVAREDRFVFITGSPGTGRTEMLVRRGQLWLQQGDDVFVLALWDGNEAVSRDTVKRIQQQGKSLAGAVCLLLSTQEDFGDVIKAAANEGSKFIVPEAPWFFAPLFGQHLQQLKGQFSLWASSRYRGPIPQAMKVFEATHSVRCPPGMVRELENCYAYTAMDRPHYAPVHAGVVPSLLPPVDGPPVKRIHHNQHSEYGTVDVWDCIECGAETAKFLTRDLGIGAPLQGDTDGRKETLKFNDVLVSGHIKLSRQHTALQSPRGSATLQLSTQHVHTDFGSTAETQRCHPEPQDFTGFLLGLAENGVPYDLLVKGDHEAMKRLVSPDEVDLLQVAEPEMVLGLERPVVVAIGTTDIRKTMPHYVDPAFDVIACCTSQLIRVG